MEGWVMPGNGWIVKSIEDLKAPTNGAIAIGPFGSRMKSDCYVPSGVQVIRGTNIGDTRTLVGEMVCITPELADQLGNAIVHADDLVFPHRGSIGLVGIVPRNNVERYALSSSLMKLSCDRKQVDPLFLFYFFRCDEGRHELLKNASTVGTPGIGQPLSSLRSIKVPLPPLPAQKAIASVLGALDDKIELNRRMSATLEAMARALFQSWFVDFDPVRAKLDGRQPEGMDKATAALFPGSFQDCVLGAIPLGWEVNKLKDLTSKIGSGATPRGGAEVYVDEGPALIRSQNVYDHEFHWSGLARLTEKSAAELKSVEVIRDDVLLNITGDSILRTCVVDPAVLPARVNQHVAIIRAIKGVPPRYLHLYLVQESMKSFLIGMSAGATRHAITKGHLESVEVLKPSAPVLSAFENLTKSWFEQIDANRSQSRTLATLRDTLLPKLLSGELSVATANT
jgi:type I restriction enzyme, S subunit